MGLSSGWLLGSANPLCLLWVREGEGGGVPLTWTASTNNDGNNIVTASLKHVRGAPPGRSTPCRSGAYPAYKFRAIGEGVGGPGSISDGDPYGANYDGHEVDCCRRNTTRAIWINEGRWGWATTLTFFLRGGVYMIGK